MSFERLSLGAVVEFRKHGWQIEGYSVNHKKFPQITINICNGTLEVMYWGSSNPVGPLCYIKLPCTYESIMETIQLNLFEHLV